MFACCSGGVEEFDLDAFYAIRPEYKTEHGKTLSARCWHSSFSEDGHLDIAKVLSRIQKGGVHPTIKGAVWEFLIGCYDPKSTVDERTQLRQNRRSEYENLKSKCKEMEKAIGSGNIIMVPVITEDGHPVEDPSSGGVTPNGQTTNAVLDKDEIQWKLTLHQIGLDVARTDRTLVFYESEQNQAKLFDILSIYSWIDRDIGYCQGMSDICSPLVILVENEADAFWCFQRLMQKLRGNFQSTTTSIGVRSQLTVLSSIIKAVDPQLHQHLENLDGGEYLFAFRMLMVLFRREFSFVDSLYLWELMWAMEYNPNLFAMYESSRNSKPAGSDGQLKQYGKFERNNVRNGVKDDKAVPLSIFLVATVLESRNKQLLMEAKGLDDVVKILNDITGSLDAKKACSDALKLQKQYLTKVKVD